MSEKLDTIVMFVSPISFMTPVHVDFSFGFGITVPQASDFPETAILTFQVGGRWVGAGWQVGGLRVVGGIGTKNICVGLGPISETLL